MEALITLFILCLVIIIAFFLVNMRSTVIFEYERGLLFIRGVCKKILEPGKYWYYGRTRKIQKVNMQSRMSSIPGQEVLSSDNVGLKISLIANYKVDDPYKAAIEIENYHQAVYMEIQVNLRDIVGEIPIDDFLSKRQEISNILFTRSKEKVSKYGVLLESVAIKDIMFPGDLKKVFSQVVNARKEGQAALERARGESAAMRNLANTAKLIDKNPGLLKLRILQTLDQNPGNTIILGDISDIATNIKLAEKDKPK